MSFSHTVLSKRKLAKLVDAKMVDGWDDPRMPTVRGIIKRGMHVEPLKNYIQLQGFSVNPVNLSSDKMWSMNSDVLSDKAIRLHGLNSLDMILVELTGDIPVEVTLQNHPKIPERGSRTMAVTRKIIVEQTDFVDIKIGTRFTLVGMGNATLTSIAPTILHFDPLDQDYKKTIKITWLPSFTDMLFDTHKGAIVKKYSTLLSKPKLNDDEDVVKCFNPNSLVTSKLIIEEALNTLNVNDIVQVMRKDYYRIDKIGSEIILVGIPVK